MILLSCDCMKYKLWVPLHPLRSCPSASPGASTADVGACCGLWTHSMRLHSFIHVFTPLSQAVSILYVKKCSQIIQFGVNQTLGYSGSRKKFSKWHFWDAQSLPGHSPSQGCLCRCTLTGLGLTQLVSIVKQKNKSGKGLLWEGDHTDVKSELKKGHFSRKFWSVWALWATSPSFIGWQEMAGPSCP